MRSRRILIVLALLSGLVTAVLAYSFLAQSSKGNQPQIKMVEVVVAKSNIPARTAVMAAMIEVKRVPEQVLLPDTARKLDDVVGAVTKESITAGEIVLTGRLWPKDGRPGLTFVIPAGMRAVTIKVDEVIGVAGFVKPGDYVDILGTFDQSTMGTDLTGTVLQHVQVLAIAQQMQDEGKQDAKVATTVTLAVNLDQAQKITLAEERGKLRLVLRPPSSDTEKGPAVATPQNVIERVSPKPAPAPRPVSVPNPQPERPAAVPEPRPKTIEVIRGSSVDQVQVQ